MYGGTKTEAAKKADDDLVNSVLRSGFTREAASKDAVEKAWRFVSQGDLATAMRRFNQGWLLDPENGGAYHGFAVVTYQRGGAPQEVEKYFRTAISKPNVEPAAYVDFARFLNLTKRPDEAMAHARKALDLAPTARNARSQISYAFANKRDHTNACAWARKALQNGDSLHPPGYLDEMCRGRGS